MEGDREQGSCREPTCGRRHHFHESIPPSNELHLVLRRYVPVPGLDWNAGQNLGKRIITVPNFHVEMGERSSRSLLPVAFSNAFDFGPFERIGLMDERTWMIETTVHVIALDLSTFVSWQLVVGPSLETGSC